jgi:hypothetical protein
MDEMITMLDEEYKKTLREVSEAKLDSEESRWALTKLNELHEQRINELNAMSEFKTKERKLRINELNAMNESKTKERELRIKEMQLNDGKKDRLIKVVFDALGLAVPLGFSSYWMAKGLKFEESGSFTSRTGQWIRNNLNLFKK